MKLHSLFAALVGIASATASRPPFAGGPPPFAGQPPFGGPWPWNTHPSGVDITNSSTTPPPPSQDPWYAAPSGWQRAKPGDILKIRNATSLVSVIANSSAAYQLLYRTTNGAYAPAWAVTTLLLPYANRTDKTKYLSYQIPYDSADVDAGPSYSLYSGGGYSGDADITAALGRGWVVSTPDYEGPHAYFTAGVNSGHATIDGVRAVLGASSPAKLRRSAKYALWGYSGGALASEWAAELAVQYAPELSFVAAALGGLTPNVTSVFYTITGTVYAGLAPAGIVGLLTQYNDSTAFLYDNLNPTGPYNASAFLKTTNYTLLDSISAFAGRNIGDYFKDGIASIQKPLPRYITNRDGIMGYHGVPQMPIFAYKAIGDDISPIADTDLLVARYCDVGATIRYERNTVGNHQAEAGNGDARAVQFLINSFAGNYSLPRGSCSVTNVTVGA